MFRSEPSSSWIPSSSRPKFTSESALVAFPSSLIEISLGGIGAPDWDSSPGPSAKATYGMDINAPSTTSDANLR